MSHNTIGLMMDCDTTRIEPDLALVKAKKFVGGGTMMIVNQTMPRALANLGYPPSWSTAIVSHINEKKSIVGAPGLKAEHLPVFACSMGDNTIHYMGHVKMMGAVQPFISGAISKTVNMPEDATIEDDADLHMEAWKLGVKAVALYRDNSKVAQPLSTRRRMARPVHRRRWPTSSSTAPGPSGQAMVEHVVVRSRCVRSCHACSTRKRSRSGWPTARAT